MSPLTTCLKLPLMPYKMCATCVGSQSEFHRELKQLTGVEACQCRKARIQRNHIACALLVWTRLKTSAYQSGKTVYQIKHGMLADYLPIATQASFGSNVPCVSPVNNLRGIVMDAMNSPQQKQTSAAAYQYNYTYIEPVAMVDTLPQGENFSEPWLVLTGKQAIRLAINTLIANQGDVGAKRPTGNRRRRCHRGKQGIEDDVREFLGKTLLQTLQEAGTTFKPRLVNALISLLPQIVLPGTPPTKTEVKVSKTIAWVML